MNRLKQDIKDVQDKTKKFMKAAEDGEGSGGGKINPL